MSGADIKPLASYTKHYVVDHGHGQYVDEDAYTNNIEGFLEYSETWLDGNI